MKNHNQIWLIAILALLLACSLANAQTSTAKPQSEVSDSSTGLMEAAQQYKTSSRELLSIQEADVKLATAKLDELRVLVADGLVAKAELEPAEQTLATLRAQLEATKKQIADSDQMMAEIRAEQESTKLQAAAKITGAASVRTPAVKLASRQIVEFSTTATILRYSGAAPWSIHGLTPIQSFFFSTFGRALPTSAVGQSATHNRLGYNHRNAVDVALHPDSAEGKTLIKFLQSQGIPFLAFRAAIPGVATGPHIHIGSPSHRLS